MDKSDFDYWSAQVLNARRSQLDTVKKAATGWSALLTAVLGVFGTATFVTGLPGLDDIGAGWAKILRIGVLVVAILLLVSIVLGGIASNSWPRISDNLTADSLRSSTKSAAVAARILLRISLIVGGVAALLLVSGSAVVLFLPKMQSPQQLFLVTTADRSTCGPLATASGVISVGGQDVVGAKTIQLVSSCPQ